MTLKHLLALLLSFSLPSTVTASAEDSMQVQQLRCEHHDAPLGVDVTNPRLSWIVTSNQRGEHQTAYQIQVASSQESLDTSNADLWDSGKVVSDESIQIPYTGKALASLEPCIWRVRIWDREDHPSPWSSPAKW